MGLDLAASGPRLAGPSLREPSFVHFCLTDFHVLWVDLPASYGGALGQGLACPSCEGHSRSLDLGGLTPLWQALRRTTRGMKAPRAPCALYASTPLPQPVLQLQPGACRLPSGGISPWLETPVAAQRPGCGRPTTCLCSPRSPQQLPPSPHRATWASL